MSDRPPWVRDDVAYEDIPVWRSESLDASESATLYRNILSSTTGRLPTDPVRIVRHNANDGMPPPPPPSPADELQIAHAMSTADAAERGGASACARRRVRRNKLERRVESGKKLVGAKYSLLALLDEVAPPMPPGFAYVAWYKIPYIDKSGVVFYDADEKIFATHDAAERWLLETRLARIWDLYVRWDMRYYAIKALRKRKLVEVDDSGDVPIDVNRADVYDIAIDVIEAREELLAKKAFNERVWILKENWAQFWYTKNIVPHEAMCEFRIHKLHAKHGKA